MIESIHIENFQAHRSLHIDLEQVTTLVGPTDAGKSSVVRFLRWAMLNESAGDITTWGEDHTHGELLVDGKKIERRKGKRENCYQVDGGTPHDAVGKSVPPDVASILNVGDVNFQGQLDVHFWLADTPGEVSRQLNQVVELSAMDELASAVASDVSAWSSTVMARKEAMDAAKTKRAELVWTVKAIEEFVVIEDADTEAIQLRARIDSLAKAVQNGMSARLSAFSTLELAKRGQERLSDAGVWAGAVSGAEILDNEVIQLEIAIQRIGVMRRIIEESKVGAETMRRRAEDAGAWYEAVNELKKASSAHHELAKLVFSVNIAKVTASNAKFGASQAAALLTEAMGNQCPLCGAEMGGDKCRT